MLAKLFLKKLHVFYKKNFYEKKSLRKKSQNLKKMLRKSLASNA